MTFLASSQKWVFSSGMIFSRSSGSRVSESANQDMVKKKLARMKQAAKSQGDAMISRMYPAATADPLMIEKLEELVARQVEAISNLKIDKITVWDSGGNGDGSSTSNFISNLFKSLPPLQDISDMAGVQLPEYLGKVKGQTTVPAESSETPEAAKDKPKA